MNPLPSEAAATAAATPRSPLEKPLGELTEEDIAQLTREDCRRFLKDKGMRRPSWNKSQAIQQVISLKALLEGRPDSAVPSSAAGISSPPPPPAVAAPPSVEPSTYRRRDPPPPAPPPETICHSPSSRSGPSGAAGDAPVGQMTIFYGGKVNVYDGVSAEKAQMIMQLAATPGLEPPEPAQPTRRWFRPEPVVTSGFPTATTGKTASQWRESVSEWRAARETEPEGPISRKASLQRYLEKRKDRFKGKRVIGVPSANMEMFLSPKFRVQTTAEQQCQSDTSSPTQPRPPCTPTRCSSIENKAPKLHISVDLNEDGNID